MLARVCALRNEIAMFFENKNVNATEFYYSEWVSNFAFLVDLTSHLNKLNLQLQGKNQLIHEMWRCILAFETKLRLWECQLDKTNYVNFFAVEESKPSNSTAFVAVIRNLRTKFSSRFSDIRSLENKFRLFSTPFEVDVNTISEKFQMNLIEMQCSDELKSKFPAKGLSMFDFYKKYLLKVIFIPA